MMAIHPESSWSVLIGLDRSFSNRKKKKSEDIKLSGYGLGMELRSVGGGEMNMIEIHSMGFSKS